MRDKSFGLQSLFLGQTHTLVKLRSARHLVIAGTILRRLAADQILMDGHEQIQHRPRIYYSIRDSLMYDIEIKLNRCNLCTTIPQHRENIRATAVDHAAIKK